MLNSVGEWMYTAVMIPEVTRIKTVLLSHNKFCIAEKNKAFWPSLNLGEF